MKTIKVLLILQLAMLAVLVYKMTFEDEKSGQTSIEATGISTNALPQIVEKPMITSSANNGLDENSLRRIIRSELRAHTDLMAELVQESPERVPEIDPVENALRLDVVKQELSYYIERGEISDSEMRDFQTEISRLDSENRKAMLRELTRALNSGELKGRF